MSHWTEHTCEHAMFNNIGSLSHCPENECDFWHSDRHDFWLLARIVIIWSNAPDNRSIIVIICFSNSSGNIISISNQIQVNVYKLQNCVLIKRISLWLCLCVQVSFFKKKHPNQNKEIEKNALKPNGMLLLRPINRHNLQWNCDEIICVCSFDYLF